jgi:hypothetical protein
MVRPSDSPGPLGAAFAAVGELLASAPGVAAIREKLSRGFLDDWPANVAAAEPVSPSVTVGFKVALDEVFRTAMVALAPTPGNTELCDIRCEIDDARALYGAAGWLDAPETFHSEPPPLETLEPKTVAFRGAEYQYARFESLYEPHAGEPGRERWLAHEGNRTGHVWLLRHSGRPRPWLVCIHGYRMGWPAADFTAFRAAWLHGSLGLNVAIPVLPLHGQRKLGSRSGDGFFSASVMDTLHAEAQAIWELRRLLRWIRSQGSADVGIYGVSLGGYTTALLAGIEPGLACAIAGMPPVCFPTLLRANASQRLIGAAEKAGLDWDAAADVMRVVSPVAFAPKLPHERRYIFAGRADRLVPASHVLDLWEHWGRPRLHWFGGSHISFVWEPSLVRFVHEALHEAGLLWVPPPHVSRRPSRRAS